MERLARLIHSPKALEPRKKTEFGMLTDTSLLQPANASRQMLSTELGMVMDVIFEPCTKPNGSFFTPFPIVTCVRLSVDILPLVTQLIAFQLRVVRALHPVNALSLIDITEWGMVNVVNDEQL